MTGAALKDEGLVRQEKLGYWEARRLMLYYQAIQQYVSVIGHTAASLIDVGSGSAEYVSWFDWIPERVVLDRGLTKVLPGVRGVEADFLTWEPERRFDVALCLQVLEHVEDPPAFCEKLKAVASHLLVSVPYKWLGHARGHIHDPVDEGKLMTWMGLKPNSSQVIYEPFREGRLIAYYNLVDGPGHRFHKQSIMNAIAEHHHA